jgi:hypothetical protein
MNDHKDAYGAALERERYLSTMREGPDYSGFRERYRTDWLCRTCGLIVKAGRGHGHAR